MSTTVCSERAFVSTTWKGDSSSENILVAHPETGTSS